MNIDSHFHVIPEPFFKAIAPGGPLARIGRVEPGPKGGRPWVVVSDGGKVHERSPYFEEYWDDKKIIADLDRIKLDMAALSVVPLVFLSSLPVADAEQACRVLNGGIDDLVTAHPDRFVGLAVVPLQDPARAVAELERTVKELNFRGVEIPSNVAGKNLDEPELFPFFAKCQELDVVIFVHPTNVAGIDRLGRYYLRNFIGNPLDTGIAAESLIFGGVLERLPQLKIVLAHGGGVLPGLIGRADHGFKVREEPKVNISRPPSDYARLLYYDTITHSREGLEFLINLFGADHIVIGTDYPFDMGYYQPVDFIDHLPRPTSVKEKIRGRNLEKLLKI